MIRIKISCACRWGGGGGGGGGGGSRISGKGIHMYKGVSGSITTFISFNIP